ncbi:hypothetical protein CASFOL_032460 [Castilleja foliolosa]|uniref:BHLH domain-containing protein n=1 Tax=Castilleja foliolosa TaxID=1961234 RepID=A0ABD3C2F0_9LAMI
MDSIFLLGEAERAAFLQHTMQTFRCSYICLWSYLPNPSNCLLYLDGLYKEESSQQPSSSSGSLARMLFNAYCESLNYVDLGRIPGFAFKNNLRYLEMKLDDIPRLASSELQMQFYKEAGIKTVVFMGCSSGELELGMTSEPQANLEMEIQNWFPIDHYLSKQTANQNTSSSSSLRSLSLSVNSVEQSPSNFITEPPTKAASSSLLEEANILLRSDALIGRSWNVQFPNIESENDALTKAILAVLTSSSTSQQAAQNMPQSAFRSYPGPVGPRLLSTHQSKKNMFKRAVMFYRNLNMHNVGRAHDQSRIDIGNRPTTAQLHHVISERRRREKINESFLVLRSLLPPGSKKDKVSVLSNTTEFISSLRSQVERLTQRNQILQAQLSMTNESEAGDHLEASPSTERVNVGLTRVSPSTSETRLFDLRVNLRSGEFSLSDFVIRVFGFLKQQRNVNLVSVQSNSRMVESIPVHGLVLRLKVEDGGGRRRRLHPPQSHIVKGDEFDELSFQEAVRRVVADQLS